MSILSLAAISCDESVQPRVAINPLVVERYAEAMREGAVFPAVTVFQDGVMYHLADGFHRVEAARRAGLVEVDADVREGNLHDAYLYAATANSDHGLPRSKADVRRAIMRVLQECPDWSDAAIAAHCRVHRRQLVGEVRASLGESSTVRTVTRGSSKYALDTAGIKASAQQRAHVRAFAPEGVKEKVTSGQLGLSRAYELTLLLSHVPTDVRDLALSCGLENVEVVETLARIRADVPGLYQELAIARALQGSRGEAIPLDARVSASQLQELLDEFLHRAVQEDPKVRQRGHVADSYKAQRLGAVVAVGQARVDSAEGEVPVALGDVVRVGQNLVLCGVETGRALELVKAEDQATLAFQAAHEETDFAWKGDEWVDTVRVLAVTPPVAKIGDLHRATKLTCRASLSAHLGAGKWVYTAVFAREALDREPYQTASFANGRAEFLAWLYQGFSHSGDTVIDLAGSAEAAVVARSLKRRYIALCETVEAAREVIAMLREDCKDAGK